MLMRSIWRVSFQKELNSLLALTKKNQFRSKVDSAPLAKPLRVLCSRSSFFLLQSGQGRLNIHNFSTDTSLDDRRRRCFINLIVGLPPSCSKVPSLSDQAPSNTIYLASACLPSLSSSCFIFTWLTNVAFINQLNHHGNQTLSSSQLKYIPATAVTTPYVRHKRKLNLPFLSSLLHRFLKIRTANFHRDWKKINIVLKLQFIIYLRSLFGRLR